MGKAQGLAQFLKNWKNIFHFIKNFQYFQNFHLRDSTKNVITLENV